eukprot:6197894-Pleurochrysis_carterae.AAC.1
MHPTTQNTSKPIVDWSMSETRPRASCNQSPHITGSRARAQSRPINSHPYMHSIYDKLAISYNTNLVACFPSKSTENILFVSDAIAED